MFGKKKSKDNDTNAKKTKKEKKVNMKRKKGHVLQPSVPEAVTELLEQNAPFIITTVNDEGETVERTVGACVAVDEAIGDLSDKKDADIGQIVNYINHGTISAVILDALLDDGMFIIIPDESSLDTMRQFDSFKNAEYELCYVDLENGIIGPCMPDDEVKIPFSDLEDIQDGRIELADKLGLDNAVKTTDNDGFDDLDDEFDDEFGDDFNLDDDVFTDSEPSFDNTNTDNVPDAVDESAEEPAEELPFDDTSEAYTEQAQEPAQEEYPDPFEETTTEHVNETFSRTFTIDDLHIDVSDEPFKAQFNNNNLVLFSTDRPTNDKDDIVNHLNVCLNDMAKSANDEIRKLRSTHIDALYSEYINSLSEYVKTGIGSVLATVGDTPSAIDRQQIEEMHQEALSNIDEELKNRQIQIDKDFEDAIVNVRNAAAENAEREYRQSHQKQYLTQIDAIRASIEDEIETKYLADISKQNEARENSAREMLDDAIVSVLDGLTQEYADMINEEKVIYQKNMESMLEFISKERANEVTRIKILSEEHSRENVKADMSAKHTAEINEITAKFESQKKSLEADIASMKENIDITVNRAIADSERTIMTLRNENEKLNNDITRIQSKCDDADDRAKAKYEDEISKLHMQLSHWEDESNKIHNCQKTIIAIMLGLGISAMIAAGAIGYISGQSHQAKEYATQSTIQYNNNTTQDQSTQQNYDASQNQTYQNSGDNAASTQSQQNNTQTQQNNTRQKVTIQGQNQ